VRPLPRAEARCYSGTARTGAAPAGRALLLLRHRTHRRCSGRARTAATPAPHAQALLRQGTHCCYSGTARTGAAPAGHAQRCSMGIRSRDSRWCAELCVGLSALPCSATV